MTKWVKLSKKDFERILSNYDIGEYKSSKHINWAFDSTVYILRTTRGEYVLKVLGDVNLEYVDFQIKVMNYVSKKGISVQSAIEIKTSGYFLKYSGNEITLYNYLRGQEPKKFGNLFVKDVAKNQAIMNKLLKNFKMEVKRREEEGYQFKPFKPLVNKLSGVNLVKLSNLLLKELTEVDRSKLKRGVVHGDLTNRNILIRNGRLAGFIDWDGVHKDYWAYDIAIFVLQCLTTRNRIRKKQIALYFNEYQKYSKINFEEKKAIFYFMKHRAIAAAAWCEKQALIYKSKETHESAVGFLERYKRIEKLGLEEFLKLF